MTIRACFSAEDLLALIQHGFGRDVGIPGWFQRQKVHADSVEDLVGVPVTDALLRRGENAVRAELHAIGACNQCGITRDVLGSAESMCPGRIKVAAVLDVLEVHDLRAVVRAAIGSCEHTAAKRSP